MIHLFPLKTLQINIIPQQYIYMFWNVQYTINILNHTINIQWKQRRRNCKNIINIQSNHVEITVVNHNIQWNRWRALSRLYWPGGNLTALPEVTVVVVLLRLVYDDVHVILQARQRTRHPLFLRLVILLKQKGELCVINFNPGSS